MSVPKLPKLTVPRLARRDGARCIHCGTDLTLTAQHRAVKGAGGRRSAEELSNGVILCWALNHAAEADQRAAELCLFYGWKVRSYDDPEQVPVYDAPLGVWVMLDNLGARRDNWSAWPRLA